MFDAERELSRKLLNLSGKVVEHERTHFSVLEVFTVVFSNFGIRISNQGDENAHQNTDRKQEIEREEYQFDLRIHKVYLHIVNLFSDGH